MNWRMGPRVPFIPQMEMVECGAAALASVLGYYGHHAPLSEVRQACGVSREGANALAIVRAARSYGLEAEGFALDIEGLKELPLPAILHWGFRHFVVLERLDGHQGVLVDPADGRRTVDWSELQKLFTGVALVFSPGENFTKRRQVRPSLRRYRGFLLQSLPTLTQLLCASILLQLLALVFPVSTQLLLDRVILPRQETWLWGLGFGLAAATIGRALLSVVRNWVIQSFQIHTDLRLMARFVEHLLHLPLAFFMQRTAGDLLQRVQSNTLLRSLFATRTIAALLDVFMVAGYAALMLAYSLRVSAVVLVLGVLRVLLLIGLRRRNQQIMSAELAAAGRESGTLVETLSSLETIKASGAEAHMVRRWTDRMADRLNCSLERRNLELASTQVMVLLQGVSMAAVLWFGGREVVDERMTVGVFAAFLALHSLFMTPLESLLRAVSQLQYISSHLSRLDDVLETSPEPSGSIDPGRLAGAIELENVTFRYVPDGPAIVQNVTVRIAPGEKVALVGPTGAGKSTIARLLLGMHHPTEGVIRFDGRDLRDLDLPRLRRQMGVVLQETFFFSDTVRANLSLDAEIPLERLEHAASLACIDRVIEALPDGYDTRLTRNAGTLSGGERQRLAAARALARDPAILLLDEATSALDLDTEARLHAQLGEMHITRIVITHRMATVRDADRILVIEGGRIVQEGNFRTLSEESGLFRQFVGATEAHA
jgi:ATP-binding cassette subfamily B protein